MDKEQCDACEKQEAKHGFSACKVIRWGYLIVLLGLFFSIVGLALYLYYLKTMV